MTWWGSRDDGRETGFCEEHQMTVGVDGECPADAKVRLPARPPTFIAPSRMSLEEVARIAKEVRPSALVNVRDDTVYITGDEIEQVVQVQASETDYLTAKVTLDPNDPFEAVVLDMVKTNRAKRADYAVDGSPFSNFDDTANALGIDGFNAVDSALFNVNQKIARLRSLRKNGRMDDTANESVTDTYLDLAVYACIALAIHKYPTGLVA